MLQSIVMPVRKGGLGNQMFQVAAALIYQIETGRTIVLPDEFYNHHNKTRRNYVESIFQGIGTYIPRPMDQHTIDSLLRAGCRQHPGEPGFEDWQPCLRGNENILLHGYFQSSIPILKHETAIRSIYKKNLPLYQPQGNIIGVHVRRGDYLMFPAIHFEQGEEYYRTAIQNIEDNKKRNLEYHIFSDDIESCKTMKCFQDLPRVLYIDEPDELEALGKMSACQGGFICANSTFSWWGAFLGAHEKRNPVYVPMEWIAGGCGTLIPTSWIRI
jgi:hypothetical protein